MARKALKVGINRDAARQRIHERIDQGKAVMPDRIQTHDDLSKAEEREKNWHAYNVDLLEDLFTTDDFADEYRNSRMPVHIIQDRYIDPKLNTLALRLIESVKRQVARLESIIERLELVDEVSADQPEMTAQQDRSKVFVVHGHDEGAREAVARFIGDLGFKPIILHERANEGRTVIEKVEAHGAVGFAVVLLTPDDEGCEKGGTPGPRARQNVVLELGYFIGRLGRNRVCALKRGELEIPSDFGGVVVEPFDAAGGWKQKLGQELETAGYEFDWKVMRR
jgi:predicted nucleotide-binding protein